MISEKHEVVLKQIAVSKTQPDAILFLFVKLKWQHWTLDYKFGVAKCLDQKVYVLMFFRLFFHRPYLFFIASVFDLIKSNEKILLLE